MWLALGLLLPLSGTVLGAAMVFLLRGEWSARWNKLLLGFASGVMVAASVWSLLIPSMQMSEAMGKWAWVPAAVGFVLGVLFLLLLDTLIPHLHIGASSPEGMQPRAPWKRTTMLALAVTLHTIPEGAILSMPLRAEGMRRAKAFGIGALSGVVEPVAGIITILLFAHIAPALPYLLAFAAGAMMYVVVEELIPESQAEPHSNIPTLGFTAGFVLMMILDVALG